MPVPPLPPLRIREDDGSPNAIPVFEIIVTNGTLTNLGGGRVRLATGGAGAGGGDPGQVTVGSPFFESIGGGLVFAETDQTLAQDASQLFWDNAGNRLGIGTSVPAVILDVVGSARVSGQLILTLDAVSAGHAVRANRTLTAVYPVLSGGALTADRSFHVDTAFLVTSTRTLTAVYPVQSGGNLGADRSFNVDTAFLVTSNRLVSAGLGLTGGGNLGADRSFAVNANVRRSTAGFFAGGNLSTTMIPEEARVYVPHNIDITNVWLAVTTTPVGANILVQLYQFPSPISTGSAFFSAGSRPILATGNAAGIGSEGGAYLNYVAFAGSWLGFTLDQAGSTTAGSNLTINIVGITS